MNLRIHPTVIRRRSAACIKQLHARGPVLAASLVRIAKHCGRPTCRCQRGHKHLGHYLTYKHQGKTRTVYVPLELLPEVRQWIHEYRRLKTLIQRISQLSLTRIRSHVTLRQRRAGRS